MSDAAIRDGVIWGRTSRRLTIATLMLAGSRVPALVAPSTAKPTPGPCRSASEQTLQAGVFQLRTQAGIGESRDVPELRRMKRWQGALLLGFTLLAACGRSPNGEREAQLFFTDATSAPVGRGGRGPGYDGDVLSFGIDTLGSPVDITRVTPVTDPGLKATYLGWATCARGCAGSAHWDDDGKELVRNGLDGKYPVHVKAELKPELVFLLQARGVGVDRVNRQCLHLQAVRVRTSTGQEETVVDRSGGWVGAIELSETDRPAKYSACDFHKRGP